MSNEQCEMMRNNNVILIAGWRKYAFEHVEVEANVERGISSQEIVFPRRESSKHRSSMADNDATAANIIRLYTRKPTIFSGENLTRIFRCNIIKGQTCRINMIEINNVLFFLFLFNSRALLRQPHRSGHPWAFRYPAMTQHRWAKPWWGNNCSRKNASSWNCRSVSSISNFSRLRRAWSNNVDNWINRWPAHRAWYDLYFFLPFISQSSPIACFSNEVFINWLKFRHFRFLRSCPRLTWYRRPMLRSRNLSHLWCLVKPPN